MTAINWQEEAIWIGAVLSISFNFGLLLSLMFLGL
tara:strand:- start:295 stop:399 length:105 start_codon:yes stop_codon:yes gene_type:complete